MSAERNGHFNIDISLFKAIDLDMLNLNSEMLKRFYDLLFLQKVLFSLSFYFPRKVGHNLRNT